MLICVLYGVQCVAQSIYRYTSVISLTCIIYLSPCFRLRNIAGNSCLQADPKSAVSSRALYLVELRNMLPARKLLQSCETMKSHMKQPTCTLIIYILYIPGKFLLCFLPQQQTHLLHFGHKRKDAHVKQVYG